MSEAKKEKAKKAPLALFPLAAMEGASRVLDKGASKHGGHFNWRKKGNEVQAKMYANAMMRHVMSWTEGEDLDPESGEHPLAHVIAGCALVLDAIKHGTMVDDRDKPSTSYKLTPEDAGRWVSVETPPAHTITLPVEPYPAGSVWKNPEGLEAVVVSRGLYGSWVTLRCTKTGEYLLIHSPELESWEPAT